MKSSALISLFLSLFTGVITAQDATTPATTESKLDPVATRELIGQWVTTERLLTEEKTGWRVEKAHLQELLDLYQKEFKLLDEEISKAGTSAGLVDDRQQTLKKEIKEYRDGQRILADAMARLLPRIQAILKRLPQPLLDEISADADVLNSPQALEKPRDVLKSTLSVLAASGRFNRSVHVVEETRQSSEGKKMTVDVVYLGLARAFYTSGSGDTAGVGTPARDGWKWQSTPEIADEIRKAIAVYHKESPPQLLKLPISLSDESTQK